MTPTVVLAAVAEADAGAAAAAAERLAGVEAAAVDKSVPSGYVHEAIAACRDSGRTPVVVARQSAGAVREWLARFGLDDQVRHVIAPDGSVPGYLDDLGGVLDEGLRVLGIRADDCALVTRTPAGVRGRAEPGQRGDRLRPRTGRQGPAVRCWRGCGGAEPGRSDPDAPCPAAGTVSSSG